MAFTKAEYMNVVNNMKLQLQFMVDDKDKRPVTVAGLALTVTSSPRLRQPDLEEFFLFLSDYGYGGKIDPAFDGTAWDECFQPAGKVLANLNAMDFSKPWTKAIVEADDAQAATA